MRDKIGRVWELYLIPGAVVGGIKIFSLVTWLFLHPVARFLGLSEQSPTFTESIGTFALGIGGAALAIIAWPAAIYLVLSGSTTLPEMLFFPWVVAPGSVSWAG